MIPLDVPFLLQYHPVGWPWPSLSALLSLSDCLSFCISLYLFSLPSFFLLLLMQFRSPSPLCLLRPWSLSLVPNAVVLQLRMRCAPHLAESPADILSAVVPCSFRGLGLPGMGGIIIPVPPLPARARPGAPLSAPSLPCARRLSARRAPASAACLRRCLSTLLKLPLPHSRLPTSTSLY